MTVKTISSQSTLKVILRFRFGQDNRMYLAVRLFQNIEEINLNLSTFLQFLFKNEKEMPESDAEFCYALSKFLKKIQLKRNIDNYSTNVFS